MIQMDFPKKLNEFITEQNYGIKNIIGLAQKGDSLSVLLLPGGPQRIFHDGSRDKTYTVQFITKISDVNENVNAHELSLNIMTDLISKLEVLEDLPSENDSYEFVDIEIATLPSFMSMDEMGNIFYTFTINANLYIKKGVV